MKLIEILKTELPEITYKNREIYLSLPFAEDSLILFEEKDGYKFFLNMQELNHLKDIYIHNNMNPNQICLYLIHYVETNLHHQEDIISSNLTLEELLHNLDNYTIYDFIYINDLPNKNSEVVIMRVHPYTYVIPKDLTEFMGVDLLKHLNQRYRKETIEKKIENILYFYNNLTYPNIENITVVELIENLESYSEEISFNIAQYHPNAIVKFIWYPYYEGIIHNKAKQIESKLDEQKYHDFNNYLILLEWKEDYIDFLNEEGIEPTPILLTYLLLHHHIWDSGPPDEWIEALLQYLAEDPEGKTIPSNIFDRQ